MVFKKLRNMKKHIFISILFLFLAPDLYSQAPQSIPYQAVVRNTDGSVMADASITMTFKIHDNTATGTVVYEENHTATTNAQGLVSLNIGAGSPTTGNFTTMEWGTGAKFLQVAMNVGNGNIDIGTQQMMSVPYALYAEEVDVRVSTTGDSLFIGSNYSIVPRVSAANPVSTSNYGSVLLPGNTTCQNEYISVTGCGGLDSLLYYDRYYSLVEIGGQCWFAENLATDKYVNGDNIPTGLTNTQWQNTTAGAYAIYNNDMANDTIYGKLYNWYTTVDSRGVCPIGWHVPSDCEWMLLENNIGLSINNVELLGMRGVNEARVLKALNIWSTNNSLNIDSFGFRALPSGNRGDNQTYSYFGVACYFWTSSSSVNQSNVAWDRILHDYNNSIWRDEGAGRFYGFSIRCVKD